MSQDPFNTAPAPSTLLKVLVWVVLFTTGFVLFLNVLEVVVPPEPVAVMEAFDATLERFSTNTDATTAELMEQVRAIQLRLVEGGRLLALLKAAGCLSAMAGAWMMRRLDKRGFHLYVIGGLVWSFAPMVVAGGNVFTWVTAFLYGAVCLFFTVLFASRLKEMR